MIKKKLIRFILFFLVVFFVKPVYAQLQFIENKGQWDSSISFKGVLDRGAFALTPGGGYKVLLQNTNDLELILNHFHGEPNSASNKLTQSSDTSLILHYHMYEVKFLNANPSPQVVVEKTVNSYNNYFIGNDKSKWASNCKIYGAITYKNIYPNIDVRYYTNKGQLKYDLIVNPGGNASDIAMYFAGANEVKVKDGDLHIKTSVDEVKELSPYSYQGTEAGRAEINCKYDVKENVVRFKVASYSSASPLVIDPTLVFSTFSGSRADNWGYTATYDAAGDFYAGGIVFDSGFPVTPGAFQQNFAGGNNGTGEGSGGTDQGGFDMGILKFSTDGTTLLYATYIGGNGNEQPQSLVVNNAGNLIIAGRTTSSDYPTVAPNLIGKGGGQDIVLSELNSTGTQLIGSLRIGGSNDDGVNVRTKDLAPTGLLTPTSIRRNYGDDARGEVIVDASDNIYLSSCTQSSDFPITANAFQKNNNGGTDNQDAVVIKFNSNLTTELFGTYLGGSGDDAAFVLDLNPFTNDIYVAGATESTNFPGNKAGVVTPAEQGSCDGFIAVISNDGSQLKQATYIGTSAADIVYGLQFDNEGYPYIVGTTEGSIPIINAAFSQSGGKQFIGKLDPGLTKYMYLTTFGPNVKYPNISPTAFLVDRCQNVYVAGWGGGLDSWGGSGPAPSTSATGYGYPNSGTTGLTVQASPDGEPPLKSTTGGSDFYFFVLTQNAQAQLYGSFFGQNLVPQNPSANHVDGGTSRFDKNGIIYEAICANCGGGTTFPTTPGVYATQNGALGSYNQGNGYGCNEAAIKIQMNLAGVDAAIKTQIYGVPNDTIGCVPLTITFVDTVVKKAKTYIWNFGDGSPEIQLTTDTAYHTYKVIGTFRVMLVAVDSSTCNITDTAYINVKVGSNVITPNFIPTKVGGCESLTYNFANTTTAVVPNYGPYTFTWDFGDGTPEETMGYIDTSHTFPSPGTYIINLIVDDTTFCNIPDTVTKSITIIANVKAQFTTPARGCVPYTAVFNNTSLGGTSFQWNFGDGTTSTNTSPTHIYPDTGTYTVQMIATDPSTCNKIDTAYFTISVVSKPTAGFIYSPTPSLQNTPTQFTNTSLNATSYSWNFGDGGTDTGSDPIHQYNSTDTFHVCLIATNDVGCSDTFCQYVPAIVLPLLDVPKAFTPGKGGIDGIIKVVGFGIGEMDWKIYNRWGQLIFESTNKDIGWDGTFKGALQPIDVYTYTLEVQFTNNKTFRKTGDITLLR